MSTPPANLLPTSGEVVPCHPDPARLKPPRERVAVQQSPTRGSREKARLKPEWGMLQPRLLLALTADGSLVGVIRHGAQA
jgi:hypothetical protein